MASQIIRRRVIVTGRVQGVFFRASVTEAAGNEGVAGWVMNRADGSVEIVIEGSPEAVGSVVGYCRTGPVNAHVESAEVTEETPEGLSGFASR